MCFSKRKNIKVTTDKDMQKIITRDYYKRLEEYKNEQSSKIARLQNFEDLKV